MGKTGSQATRHNREAAQGTQPITSQKNKRNMKTREQYKERRTLQVMVLRGGTFKCSAEHGEHCEEIKRQQGHIHQEHGFILCHPSVPVCLDKTYIYDEATGGSLERSQPNHHKGFLPITMLQI